MLTDVSLEQLLAQYIFSAFMWAITKHIPVVGIECLTVDSESQKKLEPQIPEWPSLRIASQTLQDMAKAVEKAGLATLEDAYALVIPPFSVTGKITASGLVNMVHRKATMSHRKRQLDEAYDLYSRLLNLCGSGLLLNKQYALKAVATAIDFLIATNSVMGTDEE
jgi:hypothetical protein